VDTNNQLANNILIDSNSIEQILKWKYFLKISKFMIIIFNVSYILGMGWMVMCELIEDFQDVNYKKMFEGSTDEVGSEEHEKYQDNFIVYYQLYGHTAMENTVIVTYFAFTSLSTVGFGDYVPRSNIERLVGAFMLLVGVMLFSTIMNGFIDILNEFKVYDSDINEGEELAKFFGGIKQFNH
jgi:hypothetical protein